MRRHVRSKDRWKMRPLVLVSQVVDTKEKFLKEMKSASSGESSKMVENLSSSLAVVQASSSLIAFLSTPPRKKNYWSYNPYARTPEPGAHVLSEGEIEDKLLPSSEEQEEQGWSQETDHDNFDTLSHQSESRSDTKTDPFESASDTESLPGNLRKALCPLPSGTSVDRESWRDPEVPANAAQEQHLTSISGIDPEEERDLSSAVKEGSFKSGTRAFARKENASHLWDSVVSLEPECALVGAPQLIGGSQSTTGSCSLQPAKVVTVQDQGGLSDFPLQKSRSESCLGDPVVWPFLLWCCELGQSWPHIHSRTKEAELPGRGWLDSTGARTEESILGPHRNTDLLWPQSCFQSPCQPALGTSRLANANLHHSASENTDSKERASPGHHRRHTGTVTRAHSIAAFPLRYLEVHPGQDVVKLGSHLKERTSTSEQDPSTPGPLAPTQVSPLCPASQRTPYLQNQYRRSALSWRKASQCTPSEHLQLEDRLGQDSRSCLVSSCLPSERGRLQTEEVPVPTECKSEHTPESRPEEPGGAGPLPNTVDVNDKQKRLQDISVEAGNQTSNYTSKYVLGENRKLPARAEFPDDSSNSGSQVWNPDWMRHSGASNGADTQVTSLKSSVANTSREVQHEIVLDPGCAKSASQDYPEITAAAVSHHGRGDEAGDQELEGVAMPLQGGLQLEPRADTPQGKCALIIIAVEQKGLQATRRRVVPFPEALPCECLEERPESPHSAGSTGAGTSQSCSNQCELPASHRLGGDDGAFELVAQGSEHGIALDPQDTSKEWTLAGETGPQERRWVRLSIAESAEEKPPGMGQLSLTQGEWEDDDRATGSQPEHTPVARSLHFVESPGAETPEDRLRDRGAESVPFGAGLEAWECPEAHAWVTHKLPVPSQLGQEEGESQFPTVESPRGSSTQGLPVPVSPVAPLEQRTGQEEVSPGPGDLNSVPKIVLWDAGPAEGSEAEAPEDSSGPRLSPECGHARKLQTPEKRLRARLASAHKTFSSFFESKVIEKENTDECSPGSLRGQKKSRLRQSSWRVFLKSKDAGGPKRPSLGNLVPGLEILNPLRPAPPGTSSHCEEQAVDKETYAFNNPWVPPTPLSSSRSVSPDNRRKSEPTFKRTSPQEGSRHPPAGLLQEKPQLISPPSSPAQKAGLNLTLPSSSTCCLASGSQGVPCKPMSPKPHSAKPGAQWGEPRYPGRGSTISMVSLGSYKSVDNSAETPERRRTPKARTSRLLSLQTLDQDGQKEDLQRHFSLSTAPSLRDLPGSENHMAWEEPGKKRSCSCSQMKAFHTNMCWRKMTSTSPESLTLLRRNRPFSQSTPTGLNGMGWPEHTSDPVL
ncbi:PREDICTED: rho guanine nucleotide exchange factor 4 [Condylura cristata]|uniref:rho guanine nucleotide exchange factor 4 n=1 Tax=Condylura cristata TaxID=143302 RepID=UPI0006439EF2|nr:PREDICTED: rho guanine nucleotide exchange factor 4 [Condylura cristata]